LIVSGWIVAVNIHRHRGHLARLLRRAGVRAGADQIDTVLTPPSS